MILTPQDGAQTDTERVGPLLAMARSVRGTDTKNAIIHLREKNAVLCGTFDVTRCEDGACGNVLSYLVTRQEARSTFSE